MIDVNMLPRELTGYVSHVCGLWFGSYFIDFEPKKPEATSGMRLAHSHWSSRSRNYESASMIASSTRTAKPKTHGFASRPNGSVPSMSGSSLTRSPRNPITTSCTKSFRLTQTR